ncbi:Bug family tripartite tricarboxylate transporter substrate binding protein [Advenella mimigardefordensis]|uniref:Putative Bug-like extracytoplasmic solute binding receptor, TTT family n=1 Tax=Advenella mimigardefordensis (strain DSM 17166 / LMG 22922 / DPN7) TaxID=1247726 RepID=W0PH31_ADVMD|nr:tripartite tricarboxylate transporter substrate binding protein [Advenella mimigardefordensis]AHG64715.1 putative Bug-like extracytoplasmic solute binding receptor, TTT family [Advenella mimigardefordensis DPN7]
MKFFVKMAAIACLAVSTSVAVAADWPAKPVTLVVPYPPGGATDFSARIYAQYLPEIIGAPVVVDNRAGAGGEIGAEVASRAKPDGYTMLFGAIGSLAINSVLPSKPKTYQFPDAFTGVSFGTAVPLVVAVRSGLGVNSLDELIKKAHDNPGKISYGSAGVGSSQHMAVEKFQLATNTKLLHVPYKGSGPAVTDLLGGQIDMVIETLTTLYPQMNSGKIKFLAVSTADRVKTIPDVPTLTELDIKDYVLTTNYGLLTPSGTPKAIVDKMSEAMQTIAARKDVQDKLVESGANAYASTPDDTNRLLLEEVRKWSDVATRAKVE